MTKKSNKSLFNVGDLLLWGAERVHPRERELALVLAKNNQGISLYWFDEKVKRFYTYIRDSYFLTRDVVKISD